MKINKVIVYIDRIATFFELSIAILLLLLTAIKVIEMSLVMLGFNVVFIAMDFERILSLVLTFVIGIEFTKMLCKHTPETAIDVLLFAVARQMVIYHENTVDLLVGTASIAGLFAAKKFLVNKFSGELVH